MLLKRIWMIFLCLGLIIAAAPGQATATRTVAAIKTDILVMAQSFLGQGDPDFTRQRALQVLVDELLAAAPQPPVEERLELLAGPWHQVWGPYDYRNDDRGVDPKTTVDEIYQVIFPEGYYYNVNPEQGKDRIALLRGEYQLVPGHPEMLKVRFTRFPGNKGRPADLDLWELPDLAEAGKLPDKTTIVPGFIVRWFFGGGYLREVYTDRDMRITYGDDDLEGRDDEAIYIMTRPESSADRP
jgi:hypothetical protein